MALSLGGSVGEFGLPFVRRRRFSASVQRGRMCAHPAALALHGSRSLWRRWLQLSLSQPLAASSRRSRSAAGRPPRALSRLRNPCLRPRLFSYKVYTHTQPIGTEAVRLELAPWLWFSQRQRHVSSRVIAPPDFLPKVSARTFLHILQKRQLVQIMVIVVGDTPD